MGGRWHGTAGAEKVLFASDYPLLDLGRTVASARRMDLPGDALASILHGNAQRLFFS